MITPAGTLTSAATNTYYSGSATLYAYWVADQSTSYCYYNVTKGTYHATLSDALNNASTDTARLAATVVIPIMFCATADA